MRASAPTDRPAPAAAARHHAPRDGGRAERRDCPAGIAAQRPDRPFAFVSMARGRILRGRAKLLGGTVDVGAGPWVHRSAAALAEARRD